MTGGPLVALLLGGVISLVAIGCGLLSTPQSMPFLRGAGGQQPLPTPTFTAIRPGAANVLPNPAPYDVVQVEDVSSAYRVRYRADLVISPDVSREELIASLADVVRTVFDDRPDAAAVVAFAYFRPEAVGKTYDVGRALASRDRQGWGGEGSWVPFVRILDRGKIHLTLGSALTGIEEVETDLRNIVSPP